MFVLQGEILVETGSLFNKDLDFQSLIMMTTGGSSLSLMLNSN